VEGRNPKILSSFPALREFRLPDASAANLFIERAVVHGDAGSFACSQPMVALV
jgi:hypothetical protein